MPLGYALAVTPEVICSQFRVEPNIWLPCFHFSERNLFHATQIALLFPTSSLAATLEHHVFHRHIIHTDKTSNGHIIIRGCCHGRQKAQTGHSRDKDPTGLFCWIKTVQGAVLTGYSGDGAIPVSFTSTKPFCPFSTFAASSVFSGIVLSNNSQPCPGIYPAEIRLLITIFMTSFS